MKKLVLVGIFVVLIFSVFASLGLSEKASIDPKDFVLYKSPQGYFEVMFPKDVPLKEEFKTGVSYANMETGYIFAAGIKLFRGEEDKRKVDLQFIEEQLYKVKKDIEDTEKGVVIQDPKKYKDGMLMLIFLKKASIPKLKEGEYVMFFFVKPKNEKSLAVLGYIPKEEFERFRPKLDFIISSLK